MAVAIVLEIRVVVLFVIGNQIAQCEPVMSRHIVDAGPGTAPVAVEQIGRSADSRAELRQHALIAAPVPTKGVTEAVVPLRPAGREIAELVSAGADIPGFGDELDSLKLGGLPDRREQRMAGVKSVGATAKRGR